MMAVSTALIGCLPNRETIGLAAPIFLVILRLLQGFSLGGEIPGAITYMSESAPRTTRADYRHFILLPLCPVLHWVLLYSAL